MSDLFLCIENYKLTYKNLTYKLLKDNCMSDLFLCIENYKLTYTIFILFFFKIK